MEKDDKDVLAAAESLDRHLRGKPWYWTVGAGKDGDRDCLFLYVKKSPDVPAAVLPLSGWRGFPVLARMIGRTRPGTVDAMVVNCERCKERPATHRASSDRTDIWVCTECVPHADSLFGSESGMISVVALHG